MLVNYVRTNEDLGSIVRGLDVGPFDYILAVGSSGDQSFALLEYADRVASFDTDNDQVDHINQLIGFLNNEDYRGFLEYRLDYGSGDIYNSWDNDVKKLSYRQLLKLEKKLGTKYFSHKRLKKIREKLGNLSIEHKNIIEAIQTEEGYNKVYLSNILEYRYVGWENIPFVLLEISKKLPKGGLIYASNGDTVSEWNLNCRLELDKDLTSRTWDEGWHPIVFRKM